jgi:lipopolysaccharide transport system ATP-binding protein
VKGKIASLLEVGTGFHPELTGRENVFLNGAILGMKRREIQAKFDEIVTFAGVEQFIDTPVKRYSSGMYVRLAFSVAAHLDSEILLVDEVLAVGDAAFQKQCLDKLQTISKEDGRTVLFVSHALTSLSTLCNKGVLLANGQLQTDSTIQTVIQQYLETQKGLQTEPGVNRENIQRVTTNGISGSPQDRFLMDEGVVIRTRIRELAPGQRAYCSVEITREDGIKIVNNVNTDSGFPYLEKNGVYQISFAPMMLYPGRYHVSVWLGDATSEKTLAHFENECHFDIEKDNFAISRTLPASTGVLFEKGAWSFVGD